MIDPQEVLKKMRRTENYFLRSIAYCELFRPELECAKAINDLLEQNETLTTIVAGNILSIYNNTNAAQHYDGCGWFDYRFYVIHMLRLHGFKVGVNQHTGQISIKPE
jgi:hypothetical protein